MVKNGPKLPKFLAIGHNTQLRTVLTKLNRNMKNKWKNQLKGESPHRQIF